MSPWALNRLSREVARGAVFAYPTDTVWGFGCHPLLAASVARILQIKRRSPDKGLILLSSRLEYCRAYVSVDDDELEPLRAPAARPTTWLVPASDFCPPWIRGRFDTVALRVCDHPFVVGLCDKLQAPIVSTSANRGGRPVARNSLQLRRQFAAELDCIVTGYATGGARPSEIKSLATGASLRSGS